MSAKDATPRTHGSSHVVEEKGLGKGKLGLFGAVLIGISCVAPAYALSPSLGSVAQAVGLQLPAVMLLGFIPMLLVAFGYRELNRRIPDSGTAFTWATKAFGPWIGWMAGWGLVISTILVLSNTAGVAVNFFYFVGDQLFPDLGIEEFQSNYWVNILSCLVFILVTGWTAYRGVQATKTFLTILVSVQLIILVWFSVAAWSHVAHGTAPNTVEPLDWSWFNPLEIDSFGAFVSGLTIAVFIYWGWDAVLAMNEETKDPQKTPGRAGVLALLFVVAIYLIVTVSTLAFAGTGTDGVGLQNAEPDFVDNIFKYLGGPVLGAAVGFMELVVFASALASLQATFLSPAHTLLAMGHYEALPKKFATVNKRFLTPSFSIFFSGVVSWIFYAVLSLVSEKVLSDSVVALGAIVCFYYIITSFSCIWYFRAELFSSPRNILFKFLSPLLGGIFLLVILVQNSITNFAPEDPDALRLGGIGIVFWISIGMIFLGVIVMVVRYCFSPQFFRQETGDEKAVPFTGGEGNI